MDSSVPFDKDSKTYKLFRSAVITVASLIVFIAIWWVLSLSLDMTALPTPGETFSALWGLFTDGVPGTSRPYTTFLASTLWTFFKGAMFAIVVAVPLGLLLGYIKPLREFLTPMVEVIRPIAPIAWAPIFIISMGYSVGASMVVFIGMFFPILTNVMFGVTKIEPSLMDAAKTLGASKAQIFTKVVFPSSVPFILNGLKIALGVGWMCIIAAELYADALGGMGSFLILMADNGAWEYVYANIIIISIFGLLTTGLTEYIHKRVSKNMGME